MAQKQPAREDIFGCTTIRTTLREDGKTHVVLDNGMKRSFILTDAKRAAIHAALAITVKNTSRFVVKVNLSGGLTENFALVIEPRSSLGGGSRFVRLDHVSRRPALRHSIVAMRFYVRAMGFENDLGRLRKLVRPWRRRA